MTNVAYIVYSILKWHLIVLNQANGNPAKKGPDLSYTIT
jgi:hypothetical protein